MTNQYLELKSMHFEDKDPDGIAIGSLLLDRGITNHEDYRWAIVDNGEGHRIAVAWLKSDCECVRMIDIFQPTDEEQARIKIYRDGAAVEGRGRNRRERFCPERASIKEDVRNHYNNEDRLAMKAAIRDDAMAIRGTYNEWYRLIDGQRV